MQLHQDILSQIFDLIDLRAQIRFMSTNRAIYEQFFITDLYDIDDVYRLKLTDDILRQYKFRNVSRLNAFDLEAVSNVKYLCKLNVLNAAGRCNITLDGITDLNLQSLKLMCNRVIIDVSSIVDLKLLCKWYNVQSDDIGRKIIPIKRYGIRHLSMWETIMYGPFPHIFRTDPLTRIVSVEALYINNFIVYPSEGGIRLQKLFI